MKINEKQLKNIIKNVINEGYTSWDSFEFAEQNRKAKELKKKMLAQKNGEGAEVKPKRTRQTSVKNTENIKSDDLYREITDELFLRFMDGGKNLPNDSTIKSLLNFYRTTSVVGAKNNASGGAFLTFKNRDKKENMEKYSSFYKAVDAIDTPIRHIREILRDSNGKKLDNQQLEKIKYEIQDLQTALSMYVSELLQHDFISKGDSNFVTGNGGHYLGFKTVLKQLKKDIKNGVYLKLVQKIEEIIKNGKDPLSYRIVGESKKLSETRLNNIIKESIDNVLGREKMLLQYHVKNNGRFEVRELTHECDPNKTTQENLNDAYEKALKMGLVNDKQIRWKMIR